MGRPAAAQTNEQDTHPRPSSARVTAATHAPPPGTRRRITGEGMTAPGARDAAMHAVVAIPIEGDPRPMSPMMQPRADVTPRADTTPRAVAPSKWRRNRVPKGIAAHVGADDCRLRALALWPGLDRDKLRRTRGEIRRVARLVEKRTALSFETILGMLTGPAH